MCCLHVYSLCNVHIIVFGDPLLPTLHVTLSMLSLRDLYSSALLSLARLAFGYRSFAGHVVQQYRHRGCISPDTGI
jgi:diphthamide biosynthesis methyltransferase